VNHLFLVVEVSDEAVTVVVLRMVEGVEEREVAPVSIVLVAHVIPHSVKDETTQSPPSSNYSG